MMDDAETTLRALGMPEKAIHLERFNTPGTSVKRATGVQAEGRTVTLREDGRERLISLSAEDDSILDAALRQGLICRSLAKAASALPANAKWCAAKWRWPPTTASKPTKLAAGYVLSCQALPTSGDVVVDFDARGMA